MIIDHIGHCSWYQGTICDVLFQGVYQVPTLSVRVFSVLVLSEMSSCRVYGGASWNVRIVFGRVGPRVEYKCNKSVAVIGAVWSPSEKIGFIC